MTPREEPPALQSGEAGDLRDANQGRVPPLGGTQAGPSERADIEKIVDSIRVGLETGDVAPYTDLARTAFDETAQAYAQPEIASVEHMQLLIEASMELDYWSFPPLPPEMWSLRLVGGNRLVEVIGADWEPVVRSIENEDEESYSLLFRLGKLGGQWLVLR